ncbi:MAG: hypothetical protein MUE77_07730, partial [Sandarakinorhabdus sp.]|nr:hypothetical protein [Sandarakinorhabdus sp.]
MNVPISSTVTPASGSTAVVAAVCVAITHPLHQQRRSIHKRRLPGPCCPGEGTKLAGFERLRTPETHHLRCSCAPETCWTDPTASAATLPAQLASLMLFAYRRQVRISNFEDHIMRIGKQDAPFTAICTSDTHHIKVRGKDLTGEIIGNTDFTTYFWMLVTGQVPTDTQKFFANAVLCAIAEHGLVPSVVAARMTYAAAPEAFHGAVAAGLLGCGSVVLGSAEVAGRFLAQVVASSDPAAEIRLLRAEKKAIPGFGHPQHSEGDPRANLLL